MNEDGEGSIRLPRWPWVIVGDDHLGINSGGGLWNNTGKPLLLVDPNWVLIDQLSGSMHHLLGCCISPTNALSAEPEC